MNEKTQNEAQKEMDSRINQTKKEGQGELEENEIQANELEENVKAMKDVERKKIVYELELFEWGQQCKKLQDKITQTKYNNQIELAKVKRQIEAEYDESLEKFKAQASQDAQRNIQEIENNIHLENSKLSSVTQAQRYEIEREKRELMHAKEMNVNFKRDINLNAGTEKQYLVRETQQQKNIQANKAKIQVLEKSLQQIVGEFEREKELLRYQHEAIIKEQKEEVLNFRENLRFKNKELQNVRALSQVILDQRSEMEQFFLEALEQIKEEIRKKVAFERKQKRANNIPTNPGGISQIGESQQKTELPGSDPNKPYGEKVDLNDLEWEDRERVLRLLFSKMNAGVPVSTLKQRANAQQQKNREE